MLPVIVITPYLLVSCSNFKRTPPITIEHKANELIGRLHLSNVKSIYIVSSYACGACISSQVVDKIKNGDIIIYDTTTASEFGDLLRKEVHIHIPQDSLEAVFGNFSNALHLFKNRNDDFYTIEKIKASTE